MTQETNVMCRWRSNRNRCNNWSHALLVILLTLLSISQNAVRLIERFHLFIATAAVRVTARGHALVEALKIARRSALVGAEDFVIVFLRIRLAHGVCAILVLRFHFCNFLGVQRPVSTKPFVVCYKVFQNYAT